MFPNQGKGLSSEGWKIKDKQKSCLTMGDAGVMVYAPEKKIDKDFLRENVKKLREIQLKNKLEKGQPLKAIRDYPGSFHPATPTPLQPVRIGSGKLPLSDGSNESGHSDYYSLLDEDQHSVAVDETELLKENSQMNDKDNRPLIRPNSQSGFTRHVHQPQGLVLKMDKQIQKNDFNRIAYPMNSQKPSDTRRSKAEDILNKIKRKRPTCDVDYVKTCRMIEKEHKLLFTESDHESMCGTSRPESTRGDRISIIDSPLRVRKMDNRPKTPNIVRSHSFNNRQADTNSVADNLRRRSSVRNSVSDIRRSPSNSSRPSSQMSTRNIQSSRHKSASQNSLQCLNEYRDPKSYRTSSNRYVDNDNISSDSKQEYYDDIDNLSFKSQSLPDGLNQPSDSLSQSDFKNENDIAALAYRSDSGEGAVGSVDRDHYHQYASNDNVYNGENGDVHKNRQHLNNSTVGRNDTEQHIAHTALHRETNGSDLQLTANSQLQTRKHNMSLQDIPTTLKQQQQKEVKKKLMRPVNPPPSYRRGKLPKYLLARKAEEEKKQVIERSLDPECPPGHAPLPDHERRNTLHLLKKSQAEIMRELSSLPVAQDTLRVKTLYQELNNKLSQIEDGLKIFSQPKVYVINDD